MKTNCVTLIGFVGHHLQTVILQNGAKKVNMRVATHYTEKNKDGEKLSRTTWHDVVAWNETASYAERNFVKGSKIMVDGFIIYRTYLDRVGHKRYITEIKANDLTNLDR